MPPPAISAEREFGDHGARLVAVERRVDRIEAMLWKILITGLIILATTMGNLFVLLAKSQVIH